MDVVLGRDVADDAVRAGMLGGDAARRVAAARDERDARAAREQLADEREAEARRAAGDGDAQAVERVSCVCIHIPLPSHSLLRAFDFVKNILYKVGMASSCRAGRAARRPAARSSSC